MDALFTSAYGHVLLVKTGVVLLVLALGALNFSLCGRLREARPAAGSPARAGCSSPRWPSARWPSWRRPCSPPPCPRADRIRASATCRCHGASGSVADLVVTASATPTRVGSNAFTVLVASSRRPPPAPLSGVVLEIRNGRGAAQTIPLQEVEPGRYFGTAALAEPGGSAFTVVVKRSGRALRAPLLVVDRRARSRAPRHVLEPASGAAPERGRRVPARCHARGRRMASRRAAAASRPDRRGCRAGAGASAVRRIGLVVVVLGLVLAFGRPGAPAAAAAPEGMVDAIVVLRGAGGRLDNRCEEPASARRGGRERSAVTGDRESARPARSSAAAPERGRGREGRSALDRQRDRGRRDPGRHRRARPPAGGGRGPSQRADPGAGARPGCGRRRAQRGPRQRTRRSGASATAARVWSSPTWTRASTPRIRIWPGGGEAARTAGSIPTASIRRRPST